MTSLLKDRNFRPVWAAFTLAQFGTSISLVALPLIAASMLNASPLQMGMLVAAETIPFLLVGPFAGVLADRLRRRPILIAADIGRGAALVLIPVAALSGVLRMEMLIAIAFAVGVGSVWFDIAHGSFIPTIVSRDHLVKAHSRLAVSQSAADTAGPALGGAIVQSLGAPLAVLVNSATYLASAVLLLASPRAAAESSHLEPAPGPGIWADMRAGVAFLWNDRLLRMLTLRLAGWHLTVGGMQALLVLYLVRELNFDAGTIGLLFATIGLGTVAAALLAPLLSRSLGIGPTIVGSNLLAATFSLLIPATDSSSPAAALLVGCALFVFGFCVITYQINNASLRQAKTPASFLGRMTAATRLLTLGANASGALGAGILAQHWTLRSVLLCFALSGIALAARGSVSKPILLVKVLPGLESSA